MKYNIGDIVEIFNQGKWEVVILVKNAPYITRSINRNGFYYSFYPKRIPDPITGIIPSQGGWIGINNIKTLNKGGN